jgi:hypothetical protein
VRLRWGIAGLSFVAVAGIAMFWRQPASEPPVDFSDSLTGPTSPNFVIPFQSYSLTPEGLLRSDSASDRDYARDRPMVKTVSAGYLQREFIFEIDVRIPTDTQDIAFVGFGRGEPNPEVSMEPAASFVFRIHGLKGMNTVHAAAAARRGAHLRLEAIGKYPIGERTTFRIEHARNRVTLSMPATPGASHVFELSSDPALFDEESGWLFFGNSAEGTTFSNARVRPRG